MFRAAGFSLRERSRGLKPAAQEWSFAREFTVALRMRHPLDATGRSDTVPRFDLRACVLKALVLTALGCLAISAVAGVRVEGGLQTRAGGGPLPRLDQAHVVVIKSQRRLYLLDGPRLVRSYPVDLGTHPVGSKRHAGDGRTPEGRFRVVTRNPDSPYHRFLGISYPDVPDVRKGRAGGLISAGEADQMLDSLRRGLCPDWRTALGGGIGFHGRRRGSDWTGGCIALSDNAIEALFDVLRVGDRVEILP